MDAAADEPTAARDSAKPFVKYLIFDTEAIADGSLIANVRYPTDKLTPVEAIKKYRTQVAAERNDGKDILPVTFMLPISVALAKVDQFCRLMDVIVLDAPLYRPHVITEKFWKGWTYYNRPTFVTFNGRGYDLPLMELAAFRYGISLPLWFNVDARSYEQARYRYNSEAHADLHDLLTNFSAMRFSGGLNLLANLLGKPGKSGVDGSQVQDLYDAGDLEKINNYCQCDVLDTYFVFLRSRVLLGKMKLEEEHALVAEAKQFLEQRQGVNPAFAHYLDNWGEWTPPA